MQSKKVDARLVGRTWFVNVDSIKSYRHTKKNKKSTKGSAKDSKLDTARETRPLRLDVPSVLSNKTVKIISANNYRPSTTRLLRVAYDRDEEALIPSLTKKQAMAPKTIVINQADAKKVTISGKDTKSLSFAPTSLPDIALSGKLKITDLVDDEIPTSDTNSSHKNKVKSAGKILTSNKGREYIAKKMGESKANNKHPSEVSKEEAFFNKILDDKNIVSKNSQIGTIMPSQFTPLSIKEGRAHKKLSIIVLASPLLAVVVATLCSAILFSADSRVVASESFFESNIVFQVANLLEVFE